MSEITIQEIGSMRQRMLNSLELPIQLPEPKQRLDLESRSDSEERTFKHIHQSCLGHANNFRICNQVKVIQLIDTYLALANTSSIGVYLAGRSALELCAFLVEVKKRLDCAKIRAVQDWRGGGESFFKKIVRARFATSKPEFQQILKEQGVSNSVLKPISIGACIKNLTNTKGFEGIWQRYESLCDYVHHNLGSQSVNTAGSGKSTEVRIFGDSLAILPGSTVTEYRYPLRKQTLRATEDTANEFAIDLNGSWKALNELPRTPYSPEQCMQFTGNPLGAKRLDFAVSQEANRPLKANGRKVGRNEKCPCGSGKKHKHCCHN